MATAQETPSKLRSEEQQIRSVWSGRCVAMIVFELKCSSFDLALFTNDRHGKSSIRVQWFLSSLSHLETIQRLVATFQPWKIRFEKRSSWQWCAPKSTHIGEPIRWRTTGWCDQVTIIDFFLSRLWKLSKQYCVAICIEQIWTRALAMTGCVVWRLISSTGLVRLQTSMKGESEYRLRIANERICFRSERKRDNFLNQSKSNLGDRYSSKQPLTYGKSISHNLEVLNSQSNRIGHSISDSYSWFDIQIGRHSFAVCRVSLPFHSLASSCFAARWFLSKQRK